MKNKAAVTLGRMARGKKKTMTPAAKAARGKQMERINARRQPIWIRKQMLVDAYTCGFGQSSPGFTSHSPGQIITIRGLANDYADEILSSIHAPK